MINVYEKTQEKPLGNYQTFDKPSYSIITH